MLDVQGVLKTIPHRYPFLLVDRVLETEPGKRIVAEKNVTINEWFFQGHFPDFPIMPGVLIIEALAQAGAVLMSKSLNADVTGRTIFFTKLDNARFRQPVRPGAMLRMRVEVLKHRGDLYMFRGEAYVGDKLATEAEWAAMVVDNPQ